MDRYGIQPDHGDTVYLEEEPLKATTEFEILSYLGPQPGREDGNDGF